MRRTPQGTCDACPAKFGGSGKDSFADKTLLLSALGAQPCEENAQRLLFDFSSSFLLPLALFQSGFSCNRPIQKNSTHIHTFGVEAQGEHLYPIFLSFVSVRFRDRVVGKLAASGDKFVHSDFSTTTTSVSHEQGCFVSQLCAWLRMCVPGFVVGRGVVSFEGATSRPVLLETTHYPLDPCLFPASVANQRTWSAENAPQIKD